jgi:hypothetical protein
VIGTILSALALSAIPRSARYAKVVEPQQTIAVPAFASSAEAGSRFDDGTKTEAEAAEKSGEESGKAGTRAASAAYKCTDPQRGRAGEDGGGAETRFI